MKNSFTEQQKAIFEVIKAHALSQNPPVTPRLAGGFVRDTIMGFKSHDIDVALDNISGLSFALGLSEKLKEHPNVHKISANPEKSKHLEAAIVNMLGYSVDFVHLRSETYTETRIPQIKPGTPLEDALRRDITINSLFYNLITEQIEDFSGRGLKDISNKIIETPLDPRVTLIDDPLRVLRIFRFKSKLKFSVSDRIYDVLKDSEVGNALKKKVSNERIGIEILKMLEYENPEDGFLEIIMNNLTIPVFKPRVLKEVDPKKAIEFLNGLNRITVQINSKELFCKLKKKRIEFPILKLYIVLQYFMNIKIQDGSKMSFVNVLIMKESLKTTRALFNAIKKVEENIEEILKKGIEDIVELVVKCKEYWLETLIILYLVTNDQRYFNCIFDIFEEGRHECYLIEPSVNGDFLISMKVASKDFKRILSECFIKQIKAPDMTREELYQSIKK
ncbi:hypothetical protein GINT2_000490 [Glugoides intestinalis]